MGLHSSDVETPSGSAHSREENIAPYPGSHQLARLVLVMAKVLWKYE